MENKEPENQVVNIDFATLLQRAEQSLLIVANHAAFGLMAAETVQEGDVHMPGALLQFHPTPTTAQLAIRFPGWLAGIAFREYITQFSGFLEELACIVSLVNRTKLIGEEWSFQNARKCINKKSFPEKLTYIEEEIGERINSAFRDDVERINRARNCFEHRRGSVSAKDAPSGLLQVTWRAIEFSERRVDGRVIAIESLPFMTEKGSAILRNATTRTKMFSVGEQLQFTGPEVWEIGATLIVGVKKMTAMIESYARQFASEIKQAKAGSAVEVPKDLPEGIKMAEFDMDLYPEK